MKAQIKAPELQVGILSAEEISFTLQGLYSDGNKSMDGRWKAVLNGKGITLKSDAGEIFYGKEIKLLPLNGETSSFTLHAVTIGVNFHWQRKEDQVFKGILKFFIEDNKVFAVNILSVEDYLTSVISSEMSATSSVELLKAHAVISRSWLLAQMEKSKAAGTKAEYNSDTRSDDEIIKWYDREDHTSFDVCADDHCQRYQGITRASTLVVRQAIDETSGEVLLYKNIICDTRYYKCCGGITELFENVWEPVNHPYLRKVVDNPKPPAGFNIELENEDIARKWIQGSPEAFCNTADKKVLSQVLNDYDQETKDFYRWKIVYTSDELSDLVRNRTEIDFGTILELIPLERGVSGRIKRLKIVGTIKTMIIGKELEIRKALSKTHLFSSCFFVEKYGSGKEITFILHGAGWGHGVGLCQIGAAVMGSKGYSYREILEHYFTGATLEKRY